MHTSKFSKPRIRSQGFVNRASAQRVERTAHLTDDRYHELLRKASEAFAADEAQSKQAQQAEQEKFEAERAFAIREIQAAMYAFGITLNDLE